MRIVILAHQDEVAPRMDCCEYAILATVGHGHVLNACVAEAHELREPELVSFLRRNEVETLICGEILPSEQSLLEKLGVAVMQGASGSLCRVLFAFAERKLDSGQSREHAGEG